MMKKVPKRRFKGFLNAGDWEQRKLGELVTVFSGRDYKHLSEGDIPVYGTGGYMLSVNEALSNDQDAIGIGRKGTIDKPYILKAPFWTVDTLFYAIPKEKVDLNFIFCIFKNVDWRKLDESTGVPSLSKTTITNVDVYCPLFEEQLIIGQLFSWIDRIITLHQRKLEKLQATKKALLYELFPIENSRRPKRRFKGFTDDWEQRKLGEAATVEMNKRIFKEQTSSEGEVPFYKIGTFGGAADSYISRDLYEEYKKKYPYPNSGDILISASGSIGRTVVYNGEEAYFQDSNIVWLNHEGRINNSFLLQFYNVVKWSGLEGSTIKRLYNKNILGTPILLPKLEEQQLIGSFLKLVDDNITLHQRKLEKLKNLKAAYLNEMFV